jgi:hypothetical protein
LVSEALVPELQAKANLELAAEPVALEFDANHNLVNRLMARLAPLANYPHVGADAEDDVLTFEPGHLG